MGIFVIIMQFPRPCAPSHKVYIIYTQNYKKKLMYKKMYI